MSLLVTTLRRSLWLLLIGAVGGVAWSWWSDRNAPPSPSKPPEWPPLDPIATPATPAPVPESTTPAAESPAPPAGSTAPSEERSARAASAPSPETTTGTGTTSFVNALVDAPEARSTSSDDSGWVAPGDDGSCPLSHPVKANDNSGIFHVPEGRSYARTKPERCYTTPAAAIADGYRQAKA